LKLGGGDGWVRCDEGSVDASGAEGRPAAPKEPRRGGEACASRCDGPPLFASPPRLTAVDRAVLALCPARPDAAVSARELRAFLGGHYDDPRLQRALSTAGRPGSGAGVREANLDWLTGLWVGTGPRNAFTHVFCGDDWEKEKVGGLHYLPRYAQLESEGKLCYRGPVRGRSPLSGAQYLIRFDALSPWSCARKPVGGFSSEQDALSLLATATRAFVRCCDRRGRDGGVYTAPDLGAARYRIWCGTRNGTYGIATVYPTDERPTCAE
ncbi:MAG: hypothetical protein ACK4N5_25890, partial [Myxococcales bacterium]